MGGRSKSSEQQTPKSDFETGSRLVGKCCRSHCDGLPKKLQKKCDKACKKGGIIVTGVKKFDRADLTENYFSVGSILRGKCCRENAAVCNDNSPQGKNGKNGGKSKQKKKCKSACKSGVIVTASPTMFPTSGPVTAEVAQAQRQISGVVNTLFTLGVNMTQIEDAIREFASPTVTTVQNGKTLQGIPYPVLTYFTFFKAAPNRQLDYVTNGDGSVSVQSATTYTQTNGSMYTLVDVLTLHFDGDVVSKLDLTIEKLPDSVLTAEFDAFDKDANGELSLEESIALMQSRVPQSSLPRRLLALFLEPAISELYALEIPPFRTLFRENFVQLGTRFSMRQLLDKEILSFAASSGIIFFDDFVDVFDPPDIPPLVEIGTCVQNTPENRTDQLTQCNGCFFYFLELTCATTFSVIQFWNLPQESYLKCDVRLDVNGQGCVKSCGFFLDSQCTNSVLPVSVFTLTRLIELSTPCTVLTPNNYFSEMGRYTNCSKCVAAFLDPSGGKEFNCTDTTQWYGNYFECYSITSQQECEAVSCFQFLDEKCATPPLPQLTVGNRRRLNTVTNASRAPLYEFQRTPCLNQSEDTLTLIQNMCPPAMTFVCNFQTPNPVHDCSSFEVGSHVQCSFFLVKKDCVVRCAEYMDDQCNTPAHETKSRNCLSDNLGSPTSGDAIINAMRNAYPECLDPTFVQVTPPGTTEIVHSTIYFRCLFASATSTCCYCFLYQDPECRLPTPATQRVDTNYLVTSSCNERGLTGGVKDLVCPNATCVYRLNRTAELSDQLIELEVPCSTIDLNLNRICYATTPTSTCQEKCLLYSSKDNNCTILFVDGPEYQIPGSSPAPGKTPAPSCVWDETQVIRANLKTNESETVAIKTIDYGDFIWTGSRFDMVIFIHAAPVKTSLIRLRLTDSTRNYDLVVSEDHLLFDGITGRVIAARLVQIGDVILTEQESQATVISVMRVRKLVGSRSVWLLHEDFFSADGIKVSSGVGNEFSLWMQRNLMIAPWRLVVSVFQADKHNNRVLFEWFRFVQNVIDWVQMSFGAVSV